MKRPGETVDQILGGKLKIIQKEKGYRFSIDALLLAHFVWLKKRDHLLELGTGSGVISLILARRWCCGRVVGAEIQEDLYEMALRNVELNRLTDQVSMIPCDVRRMETSLKAQSFDTVVFNPPYRKMNSGRMNPDDQRAMARHEIKGTLDDFLKAAAYVLKESGRVFIIYPAARMVELFDRMRTFHLEPKRVKIVYSHDDSEGEFILAEGRKGGREALKVLPPLFIYERTGEYSPVMMGIFSDLADRERIPQAPPDRRR